MPTRSRQIRSSLAALVLAFALTSVAGASPATQGTLFPGSPIHGPSGGLQQLGGLDVAADGTGAIVYLESDHVFVQRLVHGAWGGPEQLDAGEPGASSQPVVAVGDGGEVEAAWVNGGNIVTANRRSGSAPVVTQTVWGRGGASDPAIDLSIHDKGYLAFTAPGAGGHDVRAAFSRAAGPWALVGAALDVNPGDDSGTGNARPRVAAAGDGIGIVAWGEQGQIFTRRVWGTTASIVAPQASAGVTLEGTPLAGADQVEIATEDDDSYAELAFRGLFSVGGSTRERVIARRERGSQFERAVGVDGIGFGSGEGSAQPHVAMGGTGHGLVTATTDASFNTFVRPLGGDGAIQGTLAAAATAAASLPYAVPAIANPANALVAWQQDPGGGGAREIHSRIFDGSTLLPETAISQPSYGTTNAAAGLFASGDDNGDLAIAYIQQYPAGPIISVASYDMPPGGFVLRAGPRWQRTVKPVLSWTPSREAWGLAFHVAVDGAAVATTSRTTVRLRTPIGQGVHSWQAVAFDRHGQQTAANAAVLRIDSVAPTVVVSLHGRSVPGGLLRLGLTAADAPPPVPLGASPIATSGVADVFVDWGDRTRQHLKRGAQHRYLKAGRYTLRVVVSDVAGNHTTVRRTVRIAKPRHRRGKPAKPKH
jgi:hypothetical protein